MTRPSAGQSTIEYVLITAALFAVAAGLFSLFRAFIGGPAAELLLDSLSHRLPKGVIDIVMF